MKKISCLAIFTVVMVLSGCVKEKRADYNYLSLGTVTVSYPNTTTLSGSGTLNNVIYSWDETTKVLTLSCVNGYGYISNSWAEAKANIATEVVPVNSLGDSYDALVVDLSSGVQPTTRTLSQRCYVDNEDSQPNVAFTCVPLSTDAQWAGN